MSKTITITDPMQVKVGDKAYFKDCDFGFAVLEVDKNDRYAPLNVYDPMLGRTTWVRSMRFDHATREVKEPEWPDPHDFKLHVYLGSDGMRYIYNPIDENDKTAWNSERHFAYITRETMEAHHRDALPITELELIPKERES